MAQLSIILLGPFRVVLNGEPVETFNSDKERALLAYLAADGDGPYRREALVGLLWPDVPESSARGSLSQALSTYRRALRPSGTDGKCRWLATTAKSVALVPDGECWTDAPELEAVMDACRAHVHPDTAACPECTARYERAASLYAGEFMAGFGLRDAVPFVEWLAMRRERYRRHAIRALAALSESAARSGASQKALAYAGRWVALDPLDEWGHRQIMRLLAETGQANAALAQYEDCRRRLRASLAAAPDARTTALYRRIRDRQ